MNSTTSTELRRRVEDRIDDWRIVVEHLVETESSILAFGQRDNQSVVLKVIRNRGDEWRSGDVLPRVRASCSGRRWSNSEAAP